MKNDILKQTPNSTLKIEDNIVYKTFNHGFPRYMTKEWEKDYNDLSDINPHFVQIIEYNRTKNYISMPYIPLKSISELTFKKKYLYQTLQLIKDMMMFAENRNGFIHTDLHCDNLLLNAKTGNIIVIDPDSFFYRNDTGTTKWWYYRTKYEFDGNIRRLIRYWFEKSKGRHKF